MKVTDRDDPVDVGKQTEYRIEVTNPGSLPAEDVQRDRRGARRDARRRCAGTGGRQGRRAAGDLPGGGRRWRRGRRWCTPSAVQALKAAPTVYFRAELTTNTLTKPLVEEESTSVLPANGAPNRPRRRCCRRRNE